MSQSTQAKARQKTTAPTAARKKAGTGSAAKSTTAAARKSTSAATATPTGKAGPSAKKAMTGTGVSSAQDAIALLKADHKVVESLFRQFEKTSDSAHAERRQLADEVIRELTTHAFIEETIFYPAAREAAPDTGEHVLESVEEHHVVAWMLSELRSTDASDERFGPKMMVLMENVRHHVQEEEKEWFPEVRKAMGRAMLRELGERMQAAKAKAPADPLALSSARS